LNYMSPEQVRGAVVDARSDIFSVGAVLYELLSHQQAFSGPAKEVLHQILHGVPRPIAEYYPEIDPRLVSVVDRALEKDPDRRFQEITSLQEELANIRQSPIVASPRSPASPPRTGSSDHPSFEIEEQRRLERERVERLQADLTRTLGDFDEQLKQGELPRALDTLVRAVSLAPTDPQVLSARERFEQANAAKEAAARAREGEQRIDDAAALLQRGDLAGAAEMLKLAAALVPQHLRAAELAEQLEDAVRQRTTAEAAERLRQQTADLIRSASHRLESADDSADELLMALREVNQALTLDPGKTGALTLRIAIEQEIEKQRQAERERTARQQRIAALLAEARAALQEQQFDEALDLLSEVRGIDPAVPELSPLTERVSQERVAAREAAEARARDLEEKNAAAEKLKASAEEALAAEREAARIRIAIRNARHRFANGKHLAALQLLESLDPLSHPVVAETLRDLRDALDQIQKWREDPNRDEEATERPVPTSDADQQSAGEVEPLVITPSCTDPERGAPESALTDVQDPPPIQVAARWRWGLIVGLVMLLLVVLAALLRH
jgi:hypothetical protein